MSCLLMTAQATRAVLLAKATATTSRGFRPLVASINAFEEEGMPQRALASSRPSAPLRTIGAAQSGKTPGIGARLPTYRLTTRNSALIAGWLVVMEYRLCRRRHNEERCLAQRRGHGGAVEYKCATRAGGLKTCWTKPPDTAVPQLWGL
jgi:hypothetical protein